MAYGQTTTTTPFGSMGRRLTDTRTRPAQSDACVRADVGIGSPEDSYNCDKERSGGVPLPCEEDCATVVRRDYFDVAGEPTGPQGPWVRRRFVRVCKDCDDDGISDTCAIEYGISQDTNPSNGIPDECE